MQKIVTSDKSVKDTLGMRSSSYQFQDFKLKKPMNCPYCSVIVDGIQVSSNNLSLENGMHGGIVVYRCTHCLKLFMVTYVINTHDQTSFIENIYPPVRLSYQSERINKLSPRFIDIYNQALLAESNESYDIAAMGFRAALEILVKDFAIRELGVPEKDVADKRLVDAIGDYLNEKPLVNTADVIRILGNGYTHYVNKYSEYDFDVLKQYMEVFIQLVETKLLTLHPPVVAHRK